MIFCETIKFRKEKNDMQPISGGGFTLVEVMVAMCIIGIVVTAVFRMQSQTIMMNNRSRFYTTAPLLAQGKMAEVDTSSEEVTDSSGDFGEDFSGYTWNISLEKVESEELDELVSDLKKVDVTVLYNEGEFGYGIRAYRFLPEEES